MFVITLDNRRTSRRQRLLSTLSRLVGLTQRRPRRRRPALHGISDHLKRDIGLSP